VVRRVRNRPDLGLKWLQLFPPKPKKATVGLEATGRALLIKKKSIGPDSYIILCLHGVDVVSSDILSRNGKSVTM
jgi:hypothetical protein